MFIYSTYMLIDIHTHTYMYIYVHLYAYTYIYVHTYTYPTICYWKFAIFAGLCFLHPTIHWHLRSIPTILHGQTIQIWSIHWWALVLTSGLGVQNACVQRWRCPDGMHLCNDGNPMDYCPRESKSWWQNTAQIGLKMLYLPKPGRFVWIVPITSIWGRLPLVPAGQTGTIPHSMHARQQACF
jgi:hypothetical protein